MITDWSGISAEYCFATERPALFINTKIKSCNPNWEKIGLTPVEIQLRDEIGVNLDKEELVNVDKTVKELFEKQSEYKDKINERFNSLTFNHGNAAKVGARYVLESLMNKKKNKKQ